MAVQRSSQSYNLVDLVISDNFNILLLLQVEQNMIKEINSEQDHHSPMPELIRI